MRWNCHVALRLRKYVLGDTLPPIRLEARQLHRQQCPHSSLCCLVFLRVNLRADGLSGRLHGNGKAFKLALRDIKWIAGCLADEINISFVEGQVRVRVRPQVAARIVRLTFSVVTLEVKVALGCRQVFSRQFFL